VMIPQFIGQAYHWDLSERSPGKQNYRTKDHGMN
jgi:hypothetical protein